jgi:signal transduction histidine kinase
MLDNRRTVSAHASLDRRSTAVDLCERSEEPIVHAHPHGLQDPDVQIHGRDIYWSTRLEALETALQQATDDRRRAECMARIQSDAMQLALDLLVREPDITGFFRVFIKSLVEDCESLGCGVWLLDEQGTHCDLWMAHVGGRFYCEQTEGWDTLTIPREALALHLQGSADAWKATVEYSGDDERLPASVREFNRATGAASLLVAPLRLATRNLGWVALSTGPTSACESLWRKAVLEAVTLQATMALHQSRLADASRVEARRQAVLEERNRIARDIHDTLTQGFAAILMQLQAAQRSAPSLPPTVARSLETAVDLARTHMSEARRSVGALRPRAEGDDIRSALERMTDLARRTTEVPIDLRIDNLPTFGGGVEREIAGIAQEALTNALRHARARKIEIRAGSVRSVGFRLSVADDGRGIAKEHRDTGFGMTSMQERAARIGASLTIVTAPRSGTEVVLAWEPPSFSIPSAADAR